MTFDWVEWFGYLASLVVLVSLTMASILKLRVINLIGCLLFAAFAYFINSYPTMFMNLGIAGINIYYLWKILSTKERFKLIAASVQSEYFEHFVSTNREEISTQVSPEQLREADTAFYMLRNNSVAGVLAGKLDDKGTLTVMLDYVTPEYRDFKLANYYYERHPEEISKRGVRVLRASASTQDHKTYLDRVGFKLVDEQAGIYQKEL